jgi:hypothetical protein
MEETMEGRNTIGLETFDPRLDVKGNVADLIELLHGFHSEDQYCHSLKKQAYESRIRSTYVLVKPRERPDNAESFSTFQSYTSTLPIKSTQTEGSKESITRMDQKI